MKATVLSNYFLTSAYKQELLGIKRTAIISVSKVVKETMALGLGRGGGESSVRSFY